MNLSPGLGTPFFSIRYVTFFSVLKKNVPFFSVLFSSFWRFFRSFVKNGKERKERFILLQRTEKNAKNAPFFYGKERKERNILFKSTEKNAKNGMFF